MLELSKDLYLFPSAEEKHREDACSLCEAREGKRVGKANYFDLGVFDMVQCRGCGLISIDPIPSADIVKEGCARLYASGYGSESRKRILRGFAKSYRKGALFARRYLGDWSGRTEPVRILEIGAGDGYFSAGVAAELGKVEVHLLDIVEDVVKYHQRYHGVETTLGEFEAARFEKSRFDLVVFRDLLEHVRNPVRFLHDANEVLAEQGRIFFITPNGKEDFWMIHQRYSKTGKAGLLLLNHFHYFLPETLDRMLAKTGFHRRHAFKFGLKGHRKGLGHREFSSFSDDQAPPAREAHHSVLESWAHQREEVTRSVLSNRGVLSRFYSFLYDRERQVTSFDSPIGHEFFVVADKESKARTR